MAYSTITKPADYFNTALWSGNDSTQAITGVGHQPDFLWIKSRNNGLAYHRLIDGVRGITKLLYCNDTNAEDTDATTLLSFDSDGYTLGSSAGTNGAGDTYVGWSWLGGGTASSNTDGSITSSVSANTTSGFSIVSYTGTGATATVGHGLGATPKVIFVKIRTQAYGWLCNVDALTTSGTSLVLNATDAISSPANTWGTINSSTFGLSTNADVNKSGDNFIAYCFAEKKGFSKFGSYTGNGSATDGTFVYTGFKPAMVIVKAYSDTSAWYIYDNKRLGYNPNNYGLYPNVTSAEGSVINIDLLSNGFKCQGQTGDPNSSGRGYIYMAFAENPLVTSSGVPATAR